MLIYCIRKFIIASKLFFDIILDAIIPSTHYAFMNYAKNNKLYTLSFVQSTKLECCICN